jgi:hypothetical protein
MIVVIASQYDEAAKSIATRWSAHGAVLLMPKELSTSGWRHDPNNPQEYTAVVNNQEVAPGKITGVLTRLPCVTEHELDHIVANDRAYVASEMTAFLLSWLAGLSCPVLNRPTPTCLAGLAWRPEQWVHLASRIGIPVCPARRHARRGDELSLGRIQYPTESVTVIGGRYRGTADSTLVNYARQLAAISRVEMLQAHFSRVEGRPRFLSADVWPDVTLADVADAILEFLLEVRTC